MPWHEKYNEVVWTEFACHFPHGHKCRGILHYAQKDAALLIALHHKEIGLKKARADAIRSMILNAK